MKNKVWSPVWRKGGNRVPCDTAASPNSAMYQQYDFELLLKFGIKAMVYLYQKGISKTKLDDGWKSTSSTIKDYPNVRERIPDSEFHRWRSMRTKLLTVCDKRQEFNQRAKNLGTETLGHQGQSGANNKTWLEMERYWNPSISLAEADLISEVAAGST